MRKKAPSPRQTVFGLALVLSASVGAGTVHAGGIDVQNFNQIARGRYLATMGDCAACHTLPGSGHAFAGGRGIETPFGLLRAPNITPDPATGIGTWTDQEFIDAMTKGTGRGGEHLYPAMPYTYYTRITTEDALAIRAYLNTVPAVQNEVNVNQLPFPFNVRASLTVWDAMFFTPGTFRQRADKSAEWNRGAYLAEGLGHCGLCHTPKNFLGGDRNSERLQGYALQGWFAPNITNDERRGVGAWSVNEIVAYLKTGHNLTSAATGPMADEISYSSAHMTDADLRAIAIYLKDQPGQNEAPPPLPPEAVMKAGAQIYADQCSGCHTPNGAGTAGLFPTLAHSPVVQQVDPTSLLRVVLRGTRSVGTPSAPTAAAMPQFGWLLKDADVAAVLTYIRNSWGNAAPAVVASDVAKARREFAERSD
jgi:mono/diheme cytochrome c family protein